MATKLLRRRSFVEIRTEINCEVVVVALLTGLLY